MSDGLTDRRGGNDTSIDNIGMLKRCSEGCADGFFTSPITGNPRRCVACNARPAPVPEYPPAPPVGIDPKAGAGAAKIPFDAIPWAVVAEAAVGMGEGAVKYGAHNWRESGGVQVMTYAAAAMRHLVSFITGEDTDPASGLPHVTKAISSLMVLRDAQLHGVSSDNRPPQSPADLLAGVQAAWAVTRVAAKAERDRMKGGA